MLGCIEDPLSNFHSWCMETSETITDLVKVYSPKKLKSKQIARISMQKPFKALHLASLS